MSNLNRFSTLDPSREQYVIANTIKVNPALDNWTLLDDEFRMRRVTSALNLKNDNPYSDHWSALDPDRRQRLLDAIFDDL